MKFLKEIQVITTDFRRDVIQGILSAFPGRAIDDEDPSNDTFLIDGVPVRVEADRIVVGEDFNNYIPLKNPPIAGNPPQYREIDSIIADFKAYVDKERREESMNEMIIQKPVRVPGTDIVLGEKDRIYIKKMVKEATEVFKKSMLKKPGDSWRSKDGNWGVWWDADDRNVLWIYEADSFGEDYYETESLEYDDVISIVFKGDDYKVNYKESSRKKEMFTGKVAALMRALEGEGWSVDSSYEYDATFQMGNIFVTVHDDGRVVVRDRYDARGFLIQTNVTSFARDYGKIVSKYLKPRYDYMGYKYQAPSKLVLESVKKVRESMSSKNVSEAKAYWKKLCRKYKTADNLETVVNEQDGDKFFEFMADALGLDVIDDYEILEENLDDFYEKVTNPIEIEVFGEPVSSAF